MLKIKPCFSFKPQIGDVVGFLSVSCEYISSSFVNKEAPLTYGREKYRKVGNPSRDRKRKWNQADTM